MDATNMMKDLCNEYDSDIIAVSDFNIIHNGALVTHVCMNNNTVSIWAGNPVSDKHAEELVLSEDEKNKIISKIYEYL